MTHVPTTTAWKRRAKFAHAQLTFHRPTAASVLRNLERSDGVALDAATKRAAREYAGDVLGSTIHARWLYVYAKVRGAFLEGWIPVDFFDLVVIREVNRSLRTLAKPKTFLRRMFPDAAIPDVGYVIRGVIHDADFEPIDPAHVRDTLFTDMEHVVVKDDGGARGEAIEIMETRDLDVATLVREHPNAVLQRRIVDHPALRVFEGANGARLRLTTTLTPGRRAEVRAAFVVIPEPHQPYSAVGSSVPVAIDKERAVMTRAFKVISPRERSVACEAEDYLTGVTFPGLTRAVTLVEALHSEVPHLGVIGWDVMIDEAADPWVIEWNLGLPGILVSESLEGPSFEGLGWHDFRWHAGLDG